jgi:hypothetical protein
MPDFDTLWFQPKLNASARNQALQVIRQTGRALPCTVVAVNGSLVQVNFEIAAPPTLPQLWLPKMGSQWSREPTQNGDTGITVPADTFLGGITGEGGVADTSINYGNLSTLIFVPVASTAFSVPPRANIFWGNGPHGARIGDSASAAYLDCNPDTGTVTIHAGGETWTFSASGFTMSSGVIAELHLHGGVAGGSSDTGPPIP